MPVVPNGELAARVSPSDAEYRDVIEFLVDHGFSVNETYDSRLLIDASGAVKDIEETFRVQMNEYRWNGKSFYAPAGEVVIPVAVAGVVQAIVGLSTLSMVCSSPRPHR
jgi:kumamolisin